MPEKTAPEGVQKRNTRNESEIHSPSSKLVFPYKPPLLLILTMPFKRRTRLEGYHKEIFLRNRFQSAGKEFSLNCRSDDKSLLACFSYRQVKVVSEPS
jgi:hypothetical protein